VNQAFCFQAGNVCFAKSLREYSVKTNAFIMKKLSLMLILLIIPLLFDGCKTSQSGETSPLSKNIYIYDGQVIELPTY